MNLRAELVEEVKRYCEVREHAKCWPQVKVFKQANTKVPLNLYVYSSVIGKEFDRLNFGAYCKHQQQYTSKYFSDCANPWHLQLVSRKDVKKKNKEFRMQINYKPQPHSILIGKVDKDPNELLTDLKNKLIGIKHKDSNWYFGLKDKLGWTICEELAKAIINEDKTAIDKLIKSIEFLKLM